MKTQINICECGALEHQLIYQRDDDEYPTSYLYVRLNKELSFFKRIKIILEYLFKFQNSTMEQYAEFIITENNLEFFKNIMNDLEKK